MIVFKIIQSFIVFLMIILLSFIIYRFVKDNRLYNKRMRKLDQWKIFHEQLVEWSKEIVDSKTKQKFIDECLNKLIERGNNGINGSLDDWNVEEEKREVYMKWGKHIPSLIREVRENRLNKIL